MVMVIMTMRDLVGVAVVILTNCSNKQQITPNGAEGLIGEGGRGKG